MPRTRAVRRALATGHAPVHRERELTTLSDHALDRWFGKIEAFFVCLPPAGLVHFAVVSSNEAGSVRGR